VDKATVIFEIDITSGYRVSKVETHGGEAADKSNFKYYCASSRLEEHITWWTNNEKWWTNLSSPCRITEHHQSLDGRLRR
jgi:hypothetical protein